jgi:hypothetical protein
MRSSLNLEALDTREREIVGESLRAAAAGPFFPDWEFQTLFGVERSVVLRLAESWPAVDDCETAELAINNSLNNLVGYPHGCDAVWSDWISVTPEDLQAVLAKLRGEPPADYFTAMA